MKYISRFALSPLATGTVNGVLMPKGSEIIDIEDQYGSLMISALWYSPQPVQEIRNFYVIEPNNAVVPDDAEFLAAVKPNGGGAIRWFVFEKISLELE